MTVAIVANIARPISSAISTAFSADSYGLLSSYGLLGASANPDAVIEALFANSEVGAWYDPSDLTTMFQDSAGTTPVTADGQTVGKILDKSGRGNHATAPSDAARPLYKTDGTYHWLQFDGVDDALATGNVNFTSTQKIALFGGIRKTAGGGFQCAIELGAGTVENSFALFAPGSAGSNYDFRLITSNGYTASTYPPPITNVISCQYDVSTSVLNDRQKARINGTNVATTNSGTAIVNFMNGPLNIGQRNQSSLPFNGNIYSLIVRGALSTTDEITATETWVNSKTGAY